VKAASWAVEIRDLSSPSSTDVENPLFIGLKKRAQFFRIKLIDDES